VADEPHFDLDGELNVLEAELKKLEAEYNMYFAGRLPRPPWEARKRVLTLVTRLDRLAIGNYGSRFRFTSLQTRFARFMSLWDRGLRAREEGRSGPFPPPRPVEGTPPPDTTSQGVRHSASISDPVREPDKLRELHKNLAAARRAAGQDAIPFEKFADLVKNQVSSMQSKGNREVTFRVAVKDGKVSLTAKGVKPKADTKKSKGS
jgi:hypothetical protein